MKFESCCMEGGIQVDTNWKWLFIHYPEAFLPSEPTYAFCFIKGLEACDFLLCLKITTFPSSHRRPKSLAVGNVPL